MNPTWMPYWPSKRAHFYIHPNYGGWWRKFFLPGIHPCVLPRTSWWKQNVPVGVGRCNFLLALPVTSSFQQERVCFSSRFPGSTLIAQDPSPKQSSQRPLGSMHTELDYTTLNKPADISVTYCPLGILVSVRQSSGLWVVGKKEAFGSQLTGFEFRLYCFLLCGFSLRWHSYFLGSHKDGVSSI